MQLNARRLPSGAEDGFTLVELLITLVIVSVGMLGLAKLQAAATAETSTARIRSIMAYQAESLAGAMRANRGFWANNLVTPQPKVTTAAGATNGAYTVVAGSVPTSSSKDCTLSACATNELAAWDLKQWTMAYATQFPSATSTIACATTTGPVTCDITLSWNEHYVGINKSTAASGATVSATGTLIVHVQP
jgi:type IV pilus assembly protein PilV